MRNTNNPRGSRSTEPSAPPLSLSNHIDADDVEPTREWGPPPRYEEAIADDQHLQARQESPIDPSNRTRQPSPNQNVSPDESSIRRPPSGLTHRTAGSLASVVNRADDRPELRLRSISPSECHDGGARSTSEERLSDCDARERKKKRSSASKIKKGLENIAFFIIQILD